jgi:hypothetical protein
VPTVLWIPIGLFATGILLGAFVGARSRSGNAATGAMIGAALSFMMGFPLLAIGLATV